MRGWNSIVVTFLAVLLLTGPPLAGTATAQTPSLPDLWVDHLSFSNFSRDEAGNCVFKLRITVNNKGTAKAGPFIVGVSINPNQWSLPVEFLSAGSSRTLLLDVTLPPGTHLIRVMADFFNTVVESDESNNTRVTHGTCPAR